MVAKTLNVVKGWPSGIPLDWAADFDAAVTVDPVPPGRIVRLNDDGKFELGLPDTIGKAHYPMILRAYSDQPSSQNDGGDPETEVGVWVSGLPRRTPRVTAFPCNGSMIVEIQDFDTGPTYAAGDALTAVADNTNATTGGRVTRATNGLAYTKPTCGVVVKPVGTNHNQRSTLTFITAWLPRQA
jgi:hypothetical protein